MEICKRIKLGTIDYYIKVNVEYKDKTFVDSDKTYTALCLKDYEDDYYDGGDLSLLIEKLEKNYSDDRIKKYEGDVYFIIDCLYVYDHIPFIAGMGDYYQSEKDNMIYSWSYISREELDEYIKEHNIKMRDNKDFKLGHGNTWHIED